MELRDEQVILRPIEAADADALVAGLNDEVVARFMTLIPVPYTSEDARGAGSNAVSVFGTTESPIRSRSPIPRRATS